jgi:hypothetical protein
VVLICCDIDDQCLYRPERRASTDAAVSPIHEAVPGIPIIRGFGPSRSSHSRTRTSRITNPTQARSHVAAPSASHRRGSILSF